MKCRGTNVSSTTYNQVLPWQNNKGSVYGLLLLLFCFYRLHVLVSVYCTRCSPVCTPGLHILLKNNFSIIKAPCVHGKNYNYQLLPGTPTILFHVFLVLSFTQCQRTIQNHVFFRTVGIHHIITHSFHLKRRKRFVCVFKHTAVKHMGGHVQ